ncbi:ABC transporter permease [Leifsonia sp. H3M29-4]|uniref:ABC transporter permease n=1 Tax=Salinibacterium metalliresistens TaxID=3031321 RepID=UPI0023D9B07C|nr:ABC transporter permease [Salinibacterium metalliresistens]MDF1480378.1 ABC transporter permease [Salinibacterium metalliresistens]
MTQFINVAIGAVMAGAILALVALGMTLIYRLTRTVSLAQGAIAVVGALSFNSLLAILPFFAAFAGALLVGALCGFLLERLAIAPAIRRLPPGSLLILSLGALIVLEGISKVIWGSRPYSLPNFPPDQVWTLPGGARLPSQAIWIIVILALVSIAAFLFLSKTKTGIAVRAAAENPETATMMSVNVSRLRTIAFTAAGALSALAGIVAGPLFSWAYSSGTGLTNSGFIAIVLGGLGSMAGGVVGGMVVGIIQQVAAAYFPQISSNIVVLLVLLLVLLVRPQGLLGGPKRRSDVANSSPLVGRVGVQLTRPAFFAIALLVVAAIGTAPLWVNSTALSALIIAGVLAVAVLGLDVVVGFSGQVSLGHAGFMALGAYSTALLTVKAGWDLWPAIGVGIVVAAVAALLVALATVRLSGLYLALATLAFGLLIDSLAVSMTTITGGASGIAGIPPLSLFGTTLNSQAFYYFVWIIAGCVMLLLWNLTKSDFGRTLQGIKADQDAARGIGVAVTRYKVYAFVIGAVLAGLAGGLYVSYLQYLSPDIMGVHLSFALITMLIVGGEGTLIGGVVGVVLLTLLPTQLQVIATYSELFEGALLMIILILLPEGLWGGISEFAHRLTRRRPRTGAVPEVDAKEGAR